LRGIDVEHPFHGVSAIDVDPAEIDSRCSTYLPLMAPGQFFSHVTAAALFGMPLPLFLIREEPIHVAVLGSATRPRTRGIVGHGLSAADVTTCLIRGFPAVSPADTWCHLGSVLSKEDLVAAGDYLISGARAEWGRMPALARIEELTAARIRHRGRRGARRVTWALERLRSPVDSRPESLLRLLLVAAGYPEPLVNDPTMVDGGATLHPDLKWPQWRIVLEYEGDGHREDKERFRADIGRRERFEAANWRVIRVTADDIFVDRDAFLGRVRRTVAWARAHRA
jgi:hypothetical protein